MATGRCLCGVIEFDTEGESLFVGHCHCESCRKQSGSIPATFVGFNSDQVTVRKGEVTEHNSSSEVYRGFCGTCGSAIYYRHSGWGETHFYIGAMDRPQDFPPENHVFYDEHVEGYEMLDNLPRRAPNVKEPVAWGTAPTDNVLFLCTGNSARSILAEAIFNSLTRSGLRAFSAGSDPAGSIHPGAAAALEERGFNTGRLRSKSWDEFTSGAEIKWVITLCDEAAEKACPTFPGEATREHWGLPDPAAGGASFEATYEALETRIRDYFGFNR